MRGAILGLLLAFVMTSCIVKRLAGPRLTGTCGGACEHYIACKPTHSQTDAARCRTECPGVFADRDSLMMYESLTCRDAVEYVDGTSARNVTSSRAQ